MATSNAKRAICVAVALFATILSILLFILNYVEIQYSPTIPLMTGYVSKPDNASINLSPMAQHDTDHEHIIIINNNQTNIINNDIPVDNWWNYNATFTDCEQKYVGWNQGEDKIPKFTESNKYIICDNDNPSNKALYSQIYCYTKQWHEASICVLNNVYQQIIC